MSGQQAPNVRELSELQGEGGSDVFTSTRHVNNTNQVSLSLKISLFPLFLNKIHICNDFFRDLVISN